MEKKENKQIFALIGRNISYSFSRGYFTKKFKKLGLEKHTYINFDFQELKELPTALKTYKNTLQGMNVTIPYKLEIMKFLEEIDEEAKKIGAVNTIKIQANGKLKGYNTDVYGFQKSLEPLLQEKHKKALILGTGGASKAVAYALQNLGIAYTYVSRTPKDNNTINYQEITKEILLEHLLIINCTPLGTHPNIENHPDIPYSYITKNHILYDLIYNPSETTFLTKGKKKGATIKNGMEMLEQQAEKAWEIWNT
jgi:shikimate dehydrogenase